MPDGFDRAEAAAHCAGIAKSIVGSSKTRSINSSVMLARRWRSSGEIFCHFGETWCRRISRCF